MEKLYSICAKPKMAILTLCSVS